MRAATSLTAAAALSALIVITGCSSDDEGGGGGTGPTVPPGVTSAGPCDIGPEATSVPTECITIAPTSPPGTPPPEGSAFYKAITLDPRPGQLFGAGNDVDVSKTSATATVTVKAGMRLTIDAVCEGRTELEATTVPDSGAAVKFTCGFDGFPAQFGVGETAPAKVDTTYQLKISVPAPARWYAVFYQQK